jgi:hypothetical protein
VALDGAGIAVVAETTGQTFQQTQAFIHFAKQLSATIRSEAPAIKSTDHLGPTKGMKFKLFGVIQRRHRPLLPSEHNALVTLALCARTRPIFTSTVRYAR